MLYKPQYIYIQIPLVIALGITLISLEQTILFSPDMYYRQLGGNMSHQEFQKLLGGIQAYNYVGYLLYTLVMLLKFCTIASILKTGLLLANQPPASMRQLLQLSCLTEVLFMLEKAIRLIWFTFFKPDYTLDELNKFCPLSLIQLLDNPEINEIWGYALRFLNVFDLAYILITAFGLSRIIKRTYNEALALVLTSYAPALGCWVLLVTFLVFLRN